MKKKLLMNTFAGMMSKEREPCYRSLSFSGCGFLCVYHAGVSAAIKEYAPRLLSGAVSGASAGSIIAACLVCNICISRTTSIILNVVNQVSSFTTLIDLFGCVRLSSLCYGLPLVYVEGFVLFNVFNVIRGINCYLFWSLALKAYLF